MATRYPQGTRSVEEMMANARSLSYTEGYSYTEGWNDNVVGQIFNFGMNRLYASVTQVDSPPNIEEVTMDVYSQQQAYDIPIDINMALRIIDVRFLYSTPQATWAYVTLRQGSIQDRFTYPCNIPDTYCIRNGQILLSPTPNVTLPGSLIINYQKRMRKLDVRRGRVGSITSANGAISSITTGPTTTVNTVGNHGLINGATVGLQDIEGPTELNQEVFTITVTGATSYTLDNTDTSLSPAYVSGGVWYQTPISFQLNFTVTSQKFANMQQNANNILDKIDYCCFVDLNGESVLNAIPLNGYNQSTMVLTSTPFYMFPSNELALFNESLAEFVPLYVVQGDYSSTHSQLDRQCEDQLIEYAVLRLLRLQSAAEPTKDQAAAEEAVLSRLVSQYRRYRPSIMPVVMVQNQTNRSFPMGLRGLY